MSGRGRLTGRLTVVLGLLYLAAGIAETSRAVVGGDGGVAFWFGSLVGGGSLVLAGRVLWNRPAISCALVVTGSAVGAVATMWSLLVPAFAATVVVLVILRTGEEVDRIEATRRR